MWISKTTFGNRYIRCNQTLALPALSPGKRESSSSGWKTLTVEWILPAPPN